MLDVNRIYHADCIDILRQMPDRSVDLVLTDPPYGIKLNLKKLRSRRASKVSTSGNSVRRRVQDGMGYTDFDWDSKRIEKQYFDEILRISKNQIIFGGNYYTDYLYPTSCWIVWDKDNSGDFADCELAWCSFHTAVRKFKWRWNGLMQEDMAHKEPRIHPTQKPLKLMMKIIQDYSQRGDTICDPFLGSGTTAVACLKTNRNFIGIEKEEKYVKMAQSRIEKAKNKSLIDFAWIDGELHK